MRSELKLGVVLGVFIVLVAIVFIVNRNEPATVIPEMNVSDQEPQSQPQEHPTPEPVKAIEPEPTVIVPPPRSEEKAAIKPEPKEPVVEPAPPVVEPEPAVAQQYYTVGKGDTLYTIAEKYYGHGRHWKVIYNANKDIIKNPDIVPQGLKLRIPRPEEVENQ